MNLSGGLSRTSKFLFPAWIKTRRLLFPAQRCEIFGQPSKGEAPRIAKIYAINLDRQPNRWAELQKELKHIVNRNGTTLADLLVRHPAVDAREFTAAPVPDHDVVPFYTLEDQLFVEPQPRSLPDQMELNSPIRMSRPEIAVARSHIEVWRKIAVGNEDYVLVLEDDVWFKRAFSGQLEAAWRETDSGDFALLRPDIFYLSYKEVQNGAPKSLLSQNVFRPVRGLWFMSGYILSRKGAEKLLGLLPCRGPVDLWINHMFRNLDVRATRQSAISQRSDGSSTNSYSILPSLGKIGVIDCEGASLFQTIPSENPVFAFGSEGSGLTSLSMALSMLGYRCCSDLSSLPDVEFDRLMAGEGDRVFDAYVNIGSLESNVMKLKELYPDARFIVTKSNLDSINKLFPEEPIAEGSIVCCPGLA